MRLRSDDRDLGFLKVELHAEDPPTGDRRARQLWGGRVLGSDYLMWGANHQKLHIELPDGTTAHVVVQAAGKLRGLGAVPAFVEQNGHPDSSRQ